MVRNSKMSNLCKLFQFHCLFKKKKIRQKASVVQKGHGGIHCINIDTQWITPLVSLRLIPWAVIYQNPIFQQLAAVL